MDIRAKERGDGGRTVPATARLTAVMFLNADGMIAKDSMKVGGFKPIFLGWVPTDGAARHGRSKQERLLRQESILYFFQQGYLFCMAQSQLSNGGRTLNIVAGDRVPLDHLLAADGDLLDND